MPPHSSRDDVELSEFPPSSSSRGSTFRSQTSGDVRQKYEPLIASSPSSSVDISLPQSPRHPYQAQSSGAYTRLPLSGSPYQTADKNHESDDDEEVSCLNFNREKVKTSNTAHWLNKIAVESEPGLTSAQLMLTNHDLKPVEPERRQWGAWNFVGFWVADSFNINTWMISSAAISATPSLSWWQSWITVWISYLFPSRSSFGIWGSLWPVFNRAAMACIWYGVQAWIGGTCVYLMIRSVWPSWESLPNSMPASSGTNTRDFLSFFLFWAGSLPAIWFPVHKIRHLFTLKAYFVPTAGIAFFVWAIIKARGFGPIVHQKGTATGGALGWAIAKGIMSSIANFATVIVNDPDFARFARKPRDAFWSQLITIPVGFAVTSFIGIIVSSSSTVIYGEPIWNPLDLLSSFLNEGGSGQRFGVFIIALAFTLAQLGTNIAANSVSAGTDMTALLPRYLNIRRGGYICAAIGLAMCPWNLLKSSNQLITYLSAYSVFLSSIAGVIICDYYWVRKGYLQVKDLYSARKDSPYFYTCGIHWRGYVAYICGILVNIVGFVGAIGRSVPVAATYIYKLNFFCGFLVASAVYWGLCKISPIPACAEVWTEVDSDDEIRNFAIACDNDSSAVEAHQAYAKLLEAEANDGSDRP